MSTELLSDSTGTAVAPFSGRSLTSSNWPSISDINSLEPIKTTDTWDTGSIRFITHIDGFGNPDAKASADDVRRIISIAIIQRLYSDDLEDACSGLVDSYHWILQSHFEKPQLSEPVKRVVKAIKRHKAKPVTMDDD